MFLTRNEIKELTGYSYQSAQIRWLREEGFMFRIAADGHPRVLEAEVIFHMSHSADLVKKARKQKPNFEALG